MTPTGAAHPLADLREAVERAAPEQRGALWKLAEPGRQLDANLVRLPAGAEVGEHREDELDVLLLVVAGGGTLTGGGRELPLAAGGLTWLPRTATRSLRAGAEGLAYLTVHRRRPGLSVGGTGRNAPAPGREEGGEDACWLHRLCPECGAVPDGSAPVYCSRCGHRLAPA
jgi:quercetin dioxygenase-like cupin family protein